MVILSREKIECDPWRRAKHSCADGAAEYESSMARLKGMHTLCPYIQKIELGNRDSIASKARLEMSRKGRTTLPARKGKARRPVLEVLVTCCQS